MVKKTRFAAACAVALLVFALFFSVFFVVAEADHECGGVHCTICHQIRSVQKLLEQLSAAHTASASWEVRLSTYHEPPAGSTVRVSSNSFCIMI